jgi:hypothetical protein
MIKVILISSMSLQLFFIFLKMKYQIHIKILLMMVKIHEKKYNWCEFSAENVSYGNCWSFSYKILLNLIIHK